MSLGTPGLQKWASRYWECPGWEQFAFENLEGHTVKLFSWRVSKSKPSCWIFQSQSMSEHNPTLSLSLILSGDFLQLFKLQTTWTRRTLNLTKKLRIRGGNKEQERSKEGSKAFILLTRPQIKMKEKRCVQISSKNLPWDPLFQQSPEV